LLERTTGITMRMHAHAGRSLVIRAAIVLLAAALLTPCAHATERPSIPVPTVEKLQRIVRDLETRLEISTPVVVSIVPNNALMMSIEPPERPGGLFRLDIDAAFLGRLTEEELEAAIAHELGHLWLFTHHPYLQTEALANQIAMRVVTHAALERLYRKVWNEGGIESDLARVLGGAVIGLTESFRDEWCDP
jgi:Zn-dependent protease with chaperone function